MPASPGFLLAQLRSSAIPAFFIRWIRPASPTGQINYGSLLAIWLVLRTIAWVLTTSAVHPNATLDLVEWMSWGHSLEWGYTKHPPLPAWLAVGFAHLSPGGIWGVDLLSFLTSSGCLFAAWTLARVYLAPARAFLATTCLDALIYLTNDGDSWSNNMALNFGWAWLIVFVERAIRTQSTRTWVAAGLIAGLTLLCKYTVSVLFVPLALFLIVNRDARRSLRTPGPYVAAIIAAAVFIPHLVWLVRNDFVTLTYAAERSSDRGGPIDHLKNPVLFILGQAYHILPVLFVLAPAIGSCARIPAFLHAAVLGPIALLLSISLTTGCQLREIWGSPLWTFLGVWVLSGGITGESHGLRRALLRWSLMALVVFAYFVVKPMIGPHLAPKPTREHYPGKALAAEVNLRWKALSAEPLPIVAGDGWGAGNVCIYSEHRPILYSNGAMADPEFDSRICSWMSDEKLIARGGAIVWDCYRHGDDLPAALKVRFPNAIVEPPVVLPYQTSAPVMPTRTGVAFIPPSR